MPVRDSADRLDGPCESCGQRYVPWAAPNEVWNEVMGGDPTIEAPGRLCPTCFCLRADIAFGTTSTVWKVEPR
jgi:hypothetical protein